MVVLMKTLSVIFHIIAFFLLWLLKTNINSAVTEAQPLLADERRNKLNYPYPSVNQHCNTF